VLRAAQVAPILSIAELKRSAKIMSEYDPLPVIDELDRALKAHGFVNSTDDDLRKYITAMCHVYIKNDAVRERFLMRGFTLNHIQMARLITKLDTQNQKTQFWFMFLAIASLVTGIVSIVIAVVALYLQFVSQCK
jgi:hypothetical protein